MATNTVILIVSDEKPVLKLLRANLKKEYQVVTAADAVSAVKLLKEHRPGLVIYDMTTPDVENSDALASLRPRCDVPIIILTARNGVASLHRILADEDEYIVKPFNIQELLSLIQAKLKGSK